jgi:hypothetical protein
MSFVLVVDVFCVDCNGDLMGKGEEDAGLGGRSCRLAGEEEEAFMEKKKLQCRGCNGDLEELQAGEEERSGRADLGGRREKKEAGKEREGK